MEENARRRCYKTWPKRRPCHHFRRHGRQVDAAAVAVARRYVGRFFLVVFLSFSCHRVWHSASGLTLVEPQTFQYSRGWKNGRKRSEALVPTVAPLASPLLCRHVFKKVNPLGRVSFPFIHSAQKGGGFICLFVLTFFRSIRNRPLTR